MALKQFKNIPRKYNPPKDSPKEKIKSGDSPIDGYDYRVEVLMFFPYEDSIQTQVKTVLWLKENNIDFQYNYRGLTAIVYYFNNEKNASFFKLRWQ